MQIKLDNSVDAFAKEIHSCSGINVYDCYQCGKCSAGCTVSSFIDESPTRLIRLIQLGQKEIVYKSKTPYLCASCITCSSRCPMEIDVVKIMESIRISAKKNGIEPPVKEVPAFAEAFLAPIKANGKSFELGMMVGYKIKTLTPFTDAELGPTMLLNQKLPFFPTTIKNRKRIKNIFDRSEYFEPKEHSEKNKH
ncbi:MAG: 4Fe-4S dicluster domain-containing protein [Ignavibacteriales bacterium]|nr:4Fe-4S dicluster domain-containing protein [Ignavibacteriales bacterium]